MGEGGKTDKVFTNDFKRVYEAHFLSICPEFEQTNCGNGEVDEGEECDTLGFDTRTCTKDCKCADGFVYINKTCTGCGNSIHEEGEFCDGEAWCDMNTCQGCASGYLKLGNSCFSQVKFIIIIVCCVLALIIIIVAPIVVCVL